MSDTTIRERLVMIETELKNISDDIKNYVRRTDERIKTVEDCKADKEIVTRIERSIQTIKDDMKYFTRWAIGILAAYILGQIAFNSQTIIQLFGG